MSRDNVNAVFYEETYHPIKAGNIDGTDFVPHDIAVYSACLCSSALLCLSFLSLSLSLNIVVLFLIKSVKFSLFCRWPSRWSQPLRRLLQSCCTLFATRLSHQCIEHMLHKVFLSFLSFVWFMKKSSLIYFMMIKKYII